MASSDADESIDPNRGVMDHEIHELGSYCPISVILNMEMADAQPMFHPKTYASLISDSLLTPSKSSGNLLDSQNSTAVDLPFYRVRRYRTAPVIIMNFNTIRYASQAREERTRGPFGIFKV